VQSRRPATTVLFLTALEATLRAVTVDACDVNAVEDVAERAGRDAAITEGDAALIEDMGRAAEVDDVER
jgi:hypothetical protein